MTKQEFIFALFDNGNGLTLDQIAQIEEQLPETFPDGLIDEIAEDMDESKEYPGVWESALYQARDVFMDSIAGDAEDMLMLRDIFSEQWHIGLTDMQVYHLWYAIGKAG